MTFASHHHPIRAHLVLLWYDVYFVIGKLNSPDARANKGNDDVARGQNRKMAVMDVSMRQRQNEDAGKYLSNGSVYLLPQPCTI